MHLTYARDAHIMDYMHDTPLPPAPRKRIHALPDAARLLLPNQSILTSAGEARCVREYGRKQGWVMVQRKTDDQIRVWRIS
jgi:hypothetical protein